ncbi:MAG: adenosylcobinamide-phosphate synthase CbiB [Methylococcales bacterium]
MTNALIIFLALGLDACVGEPRRFHPLVGFGHLAQALERRIHSDSVVRGTIAVLLLIAPFTVLAMLISRLPWGTAIEVMLLYLAIAWTSLDEHAGRVRDALIANDLSSARQGIGLLVSRDTAALDRSGVAKAVVESVLENGNDAIFGAIFWFVVAGAPGVVCYRLGNTLDAMWGYRDPRYLRFGRAAARFDDLLNFLPARLTALSYALLGDFKRAVRCWRIQGATWKSPNAGPVMAAGAGSLGVVLGGAAVYHGLAQIRPALGEGQTADADDIDRALRLIRRALLLWLAILVSGGWLVDHCTAA